MSNQPFEAAPMQNPFVSPDPQPVAGFQNTLPVLVVYPIFVTAIAFLAPEKPLLAEGALQCAAVLAVLTSATAGLYKWISQRDHEPLRLVWVGLLGIFLLLATPAFLPITRVVVLFAVFLLRPWSLLHAVCFCYDIYSGSAQTMVGYIILLAAFVALRKLLLVNPYCLARAPTPLLIGTFAGSLGLWALIFGDLKMLPIMALAVGAAAYMMLTHTGALRTHSNVFVAGSLSLVLETLVLRTALLNPAELALSVALPYLVPLQHLEVVAQTQVERSLIIKELLAHQDTRAIFNFLMLNTAFMFVQLLYLFRSKSLGLLSDSLHMALDCASLALGLVAGVLLKMPEDRNSKYPFGLRHFEILAGFTNGTLLVGISGSIIFEAIGRFFVPVALQKTTELIVVSVLGLLVNLVGIFAFNHGHAHGHSHGHTHDSQHDHDHSHDSLHSHSHSHSHNHKLEKSQHPHMNDNMRGIFLHILADTLGSVGVVISTILTRIFKWHGFDPAASIIIAILIFFTAIPLIKSTALALLLKLENNKETDVRNALNEVTAVKGVKSFTTPRFWPVNGKIRGFIHIQIYRGENGAYLKKLVTDVFKRHDIDVLIQLENDYDPCWCRD